MRPGRSLVALVIAAAVSAPGCGVDPADVAGDYTLSLTKRENGCSFEDWTEGDTDSNVPVVITQDGGSVSGTVEGIWGVFLDAWLGSNVYTGTVDGHDVTMTIIGTNSATQGDCTHTFNSRVDASLDGDLLSGWVEYSAATNDNTDCGTIEGCVTRHEFNGTRPPQ
jgi:hypothetical protein